MAFSMFRPFFVNSDNIKWYGTKRGNNIEINGGRQYMIRVRSLEQLENMTNRLLVETVCPKCGAIAISTMPDAEMILVFGCKMCANIDSSELLSFDNFLMSDVSMEEVTDTLTSQAELLS